MKKVICLIIATIILLIPLFYSQTYASENVTYLCINKLCAYPAIGFDEKNRNSDYNEDNYLTPTEFLKILNTLYNNNYVLTTPNSTHNVKNKRPLVLIFNNLNYSSSTRSNGFVDKLIIDRKGNIATYTSKKSINERIAYDNECITILESFVALHPSFSHNDARAVIAINNADGIFGYKTAKSNATSKYEIKRAMQVATKLKSMGYIFGCSGFESNNTSDMEFASEVTLWNNHTKTICGETNIYLTTHELSSDYKSNLLASSGFNTFISWENEIDTLSGKTLREKYITDKLFNVEYIYDTEHRHKRLLTS